MKTYNVLIVHGPEESRELALGLADWLPVTGILEESTEVVFYFDEETNVDEIIDFYRSRLPNSGLTFEHGKVEEQNWNAEFEASLRPVAITGTLVVAQSWNREEVELEEGQILVTIDPKMSFGTGHHETTRLVTRLMEDLVLEGKRVLDAGTGTGILSIIAAKRGAARVLAFDNNEWAENNTRENLVLNDVADDVDVFLGEMDQVGDEKFDLILANMQTFIILPLLSRFASCMSGPEARLITSGVLIEDREELYEAAEKAGMTIDREERENEWLGSRFRPRAI